MSQANPEPDSDSTDSLDGLDTDTVSDVSVGDVLTVGGETVHVIGTWEPPILALPELFVIADGRRDTVVVADEEVGFRSEYDDEREQWAEDAAIPSDDVRRVESDPEGVLRTIRESDLTVTDSRESPIHPDGEPGTFKAAFRTDTHAVEIYKDSGETSDVGDYPEGYGDETWYAFVRPFPDGDTATVTLDGFGASDAEHVEISGVYRREDSGSFGALAGANGFHGWYTASEVAAFCNPKMDGDRFGSVRETYGGRIKWADRGHNAKAEFVPVEN